MVEIPSTTPPEWSKQRKLLKAYLLSSDHSLLSAAIETIIQAKWGDFPVTVSGVEGPALDRVIKVLGALDIENTVHVHKGLGVGGELSGQRSGQSNATIQVPYGAARFYDYEVLIPFCIEKTLAEMAGRGLTVAPPVVESLYLIYLRTASIYPSYGDVENRIETDVVKAVPHGVLSPLFALSEASGLIGNMYRHLMEMSHKALLYLGCHPGNIGYGTIESAVDDHVSKALNEYGQKASYTTSTAYLTSRGRSPSSYPTFPKVVRSYRYSLSQMSTVVSNVSSTELVGYIPSSGIWQVMKKDKARIPLKVVECLKLRLCGKTEPEVCEELGFEDLPEYESWLRDNYIDLEPRHRRSVYEEWLEAAEKLGVAISTTKSLSVDTDQSPESVQVQTGDEDTENHTEEELRGHINNTGDYWDVEFDGQKAPPLKNLLGFRYIVFLLRYPDHPTERNSSWFVHSILRPN